MAAEFDARALNWRFVVPSEPPGLLLLPVGDEVVDEAVIADASPPSLARALEADGYPAVAVADVGRWARLAGDEAPSLLARLASLVAPGGWLFAGFPNPWFPGHVRNGGSLRRRRVNRILRQAGLVPMDAYLMFPDNQCPAYLVPVAGSAELRSFLRQLFLPYPGTTKGWRASVKQRALFVARAAALLAPQRVRAGFAPAVGVVAVRPS